MEKKFKRKRKQMKNDELNQPKPKTQMEKDFLISENGMCVIDGSSLEGGGQILRNCTSLAALLSKTIRIVNIRAGRPKPGLKAQHLCGIVLIRDFYGAILTGAKENSEEIEFSCKMQFHSNQREFIVDTNTAGSICLIIQIALPCMIFGPDKLKLKMRGGTNAANAPQIDYTLLLFKPIAERMGMKLEINVLKRGFYPKGGGLVELITYPIKTLSPITMTQRGKIVSVISRAYSSGILSLQVAERISEAALDAVKRYFNGENIEFKFDVVKEGPETAFGEGAGIIMHAITDTGCILGGSSLKDRDKKPEKVGTEAAEELIRNIKFGGCVDEYLQDQLILFMALAKGKSSVLCGPLTLHTKTSIHFTECLTGVKFNISTEHCTTIDDDTVLIECEGMGFINPNLKY